jgi:hypothetical protein
MAGALVDTLEQIGLPYSLCGLKLLIAEEYGRKMIRVRSTQRTAGRSVYSPSLPSEHA